MNSPNDPTVPAGLRCLLCEGERLEPVWSLTGSEVRALWRSVGKNLSEEAMVSLPPARIVTQFECHRCGFRFFDPGLAGGGKFYEELGEGSYYATVRPEFDFALKLPVLEQGHSVLDVGGGDGAFLDLARRSGIRTFAVELNPRAAAACAAKGHTTFGKFLEDISPSEVGGGVDMLTLFQVVEHVPDPKGFLRGAARLVKPGGLLVVAVPNNEGQHRLLPYDPGNMPPHHISRWRMSDLERLGRECGLEVAHRGADVLYGRSIQSFWSQHNQLAAAIGRPPHPGGNWLPGLLSLGYRALGCRHYFPRRGVSIYAAYRKS